jgi:aromatic-L-amino-acid/L-tryptophan decarboxylase
MDIEEFRRHARAFSDWMADYLSAVEEFPVRSQVCPGDLLGQLPPACPEQGEAMETIFADFQEKVLPGMTHWQHPRFFAYFPANSSPPSVLAEMLTAVMAAQCMLWETSPAATEMEVRMTEWLRDLLGLPAAFTGCIQESASAATLCAIVAACEKATAGRFSRDGLAGGPPPVVYTSAEAHSSVEKGARIAGIGARYVRKIAVREDHGMDPAALAGAIREDRAQGRLPVCIVASFGATGLGSFDPLNEIGRIARKEDIFLHVDGAWAGSALILPEVRPLIGGIEFADSFVFNPHKWLFTNFDCSVFYMRDPRALAGALSLTPAYLESGGVEDIPEFRDWSISLGRRFRALKLWFVLRSYGAEALREKLRAHIAWTERLSGLIRAAPDFALTSEPRLALLTFRYAPQWARSGPELDTVNENLLQRVNDGGRLYLTKTRVNGRVVIRFAIGQLHTEWRHVAEGWEAVQEIARAMTPDGLIT